MDFMNKKTEIQKICNLFKNEHNGAVALDNAAVSL